jgi:ribosomal protein S18 acetylase RimI-like enzyme
MTLVIEPLSEQNARLLGDLLVALAANGDERFFHPHPLTREAASDLAAATTSDIYLVAVDDGVAVAYGLLRGFDAGHDVPSLGLAVLPSARGTGVAVAMTENLHDIARERQAASVRLRVYPENQRAIALYTQLGYRFADGTEAGQLVGILDLV